jgi:hypothetical protein
VTASDSPEEEQLIVSLSKSHGLKEGKVKFLRLQGIAGVRWMDEAIYDGFTALLGIFFSFLSERISLHG